MRAWRLKITFCVCLFVPPSPILNSRLYGLQAGCSTAQTKLTLLLLLNLPYPPHLAHIHLGNLRFSVASKSLFGLVHFWFLIRILICSAALHCIAQLGIHVIGLLLPNLDLIHPPRIHFCRRGAITNCVPPILPLNNPLCLSPALKTTADNPSHHLPTCTHLWTYSAHETRILHPSARAFHFPLHRSTTNSILPCYLGQCVLPGSYYHIISH